MERNFAANIELIRPIIRWMREQLEGALFDERTLKKIELGVEEALVNIIRHAYLGKPENITVGVTVNKKKSVEIVIKDHGPPFDPLSIPLPDVEREEREIGGLGIMMMRQNMDEVRYKRDGKMNVLTLVKTLSV